MAVGAILQCSAFSIAQLIVGRIICGVGNGINTSTVPVWQAECSKTHRRGQTVMAELCIVVGGVALSYWLDFGFSYLEPSTAAWRVPIAFQLVFTFSVIATIMTMPESPRWLVLRDRGDEAASVLSAIHDLPVDDTYVTSEIEAIRVTVHTAKQGSFQDLIKRDKKKNLQRTLLAYGTQAAARIGRGLLRFLTLGKP